MEENFNYEREIYIDETALDVEWLEQPRLMVKYAKYAAEMRKRYDLAKEELEVVRAELDKSIRTDPERYGLAKVTDTAVSSIIVTSEEYQRASKAVADAKYESDLAMLVVKAFEQRKDALENLVKLHGQQYFAGPRVPRDITKERENKHANQIVGKNIKRKIN